jgi:NADH-ubiquinone oxidoreductase chain 2
LIRQNLLFFFIIVFGSIITISSNSWLGAWIGLEINLISLIPLINKKNNLLSIEASLIYFINQALASSIFLFAILILICNRRRDYFLFNFNYLYLILRSLILKIGRAPFHFWLPLVMEGLTWINNLLLITWQKLAPFILISYCLKINLIYLFIILSSIFGSIGGFNQTSLRKIIAFSSINHIRWILSAIIINNIIWKIYFIIYSYISINLICLLNLFNLFFFNQLFSINFKNLNLKFILFINILSIGGLPPFLGFFPKIIIIQTLTNKFYYLILIILICFTLITLYFYLRLIYSRFILNLIQFKNFYKKNLININNNTFILIKFSYLTNFSLIFLFIIYYYY